MPVSLALAARAYDHQVSETVRALKSGSLVERGQLTLMHLPTPGQRELISKRTSLIQKALALKDRRAAAIAVAEMLACYGDKIKDDVRKVAALFVREMDDLPIWAIERGCTAIRMGSAPGISFTFPPTTIEARVLVESYIKPLVDESFEIGLVLNGRKADYVPTPEERERVSLKFNDLTKDLHATVEKTTAADEVERQRKLDKLAALSDRRILDEYAAAGIAPIYASEGVLLSPDMARMTGAWGRALTRAKAGQGAGGQDHGQGAGQELAP
jgi:hypothetical protein